MYGVRPKVLVHLERDALDLTRGKAMLHGHLVREPHDRLVEARRGIDLELDVEQLPVLPEVRDDVPEVGLGRTGERVGEPARVAAGERVVEATFSLEGGG